MPVELDFARPLARDRNARRIAPAAGLGVDPVGADHELVELVVEHDRLAHHVARTVDQIVLDPDDDLRAEARELAGVALPAPGAW
jgi:hypothetical protein